MVQPAIYSCDLCKQHTDARKLLRFGVLDEYSHICRRHELDVCEECALKMNEDRVVDHIRREMGIAE